MTTKAFNHFKIHVETQPFKTSKLGGYIILYPETLKYLNNPSQYYIDEAAKYRELCMFPSDKPVLRIEGENIIITSSKSCGQSSIHYKHVKRVRIYGYNY